MPGHQLPKPDDAYVRNLRLHLQGVWSAAHANWRSNIDPWYWRTVKIWPEGTDRPEYIPSTARRLVDVAADTQLAFDPKFHRPVIGANRSQEVKMAGDRVEAALGAVVMDAMLEETTLAFKSDAKYLCAYGYGVLEGPTLDLADKPKQPVKGEFDKKETDKEFGWREIDFKNTQRQWNPIRIRSYHPARTLLDPTVKKPLEGVRFDRRYVDKLVAMVEQAQERGADENKPDFVIPKGKFPFPITNPKLAVEVSEYYSAEWHALMAGDTMLLIERNVYGFTPWNHNFTGFGQEITSSQAGIESSGAGGGTFSANDPFYLAQGLLDGVIPGLLMEAQTASAKHNAIIERGFLQRWVSQSTDPAEVKEQIDGGGIVQVDKDETGFIEYPEFGRSLFQIGDDAAKDIESGTYPRDISGQRQQGVTTVGQQALLLTGGNKKFTSLSKNLDLTATTIGMNILKLVDRLERPIHVGGLVLDPADIKHDYSITAEFQTFDAVLQLQEREMGMREVGMGIKSKQTYRETDLRIQNESEEFMRLVEEKVLEMPEVASLLAREVAKEKGLLDAIENIAPTETPSNGATVVAPEISDLAGGGGPRAIGNSTQTVRPPTPPLPPVTRP